MKNQIKKYLIAILLLSAFNPMVSYNYICLILILMLYLIIKLKKIFSEKRFWFYREDEVFITNLTGFSLYLLRVVVPTLSSSVKALEYELEIKVAKLSPIGAMIPITRISYFYNLKRFENYLIGDPKLVIFYIFPLLTLITLLVYNRKFKNKEIHLWLSVVLIFSIFSAQALGFYSIAYLLGKTFNAMNLYEIMILPLRKPAKWLLVLAVVYGVYLSLLTSSVVENVQRKLKPIVIVFLSILIITPFGLYPFSMVFSGDLGGALHPVNIPDEYYSTKRIVNDDNGVLIFPIHIDRPSLAIENRKITDEFFNYFYNKVSYEAGGFDSYPYNVKYLGTIYSGIVLGKTSNIGNLLIPLGISSIILDKSVSYTIPHTKWKPKLFSNNEIENLISNIDKQKDLRLVLKTTNLEVYKNNETTSMLYIPTKVLLNYLDYEIFYSISLPMPFKDCALLDVDSKTNNLKLADLIILPYNNPVISILSSSDEEHLVKVDNIKFDDKWESYKLAYIGMSELSRYYRLYNHLGFPSYSAYTIATRHSGSQLHISKKVTNGHYKVLARVFGNGTIKVSLNGNPKRIDINSKHLTFIDLGELKVQNNSADIKIKTVKGNLIFDCIYLVNDSTLLKLKNKLKEELRNKTLIYILEVESDFYRSDAKIIGDINASNGKLLVLVDKNSKVWQDIEIVKNGTYRIALKGIGEFKVRIGDHEFILKANSSNFTYTPLFNLTKGKYRLEVIPLNAKNLVKNPSFEKTFAGLPESWKIGNTKNFKISFDKGYDGKYSLKVSTSTTKPKTWSWIRSEPIKVEPGKEYLVITHIKYHNVKGSRIKIEAYYSDENKWKQLTPFIPAGRSGTSDWQEYSAIIKIPENVTKIRVVLNAGWVLDKSKGEAITWFDDIEVIPLDEAPKLDVIWLYSTKTNQTIDQLFEVKEKPAEIINYTKINPTLWKVKVNATKPFMLSFAEAYDPLWEARVYKNGKLVEKVRSIPLYSVINGFWINETGNLEIVIRYTPQDWFELGLKISGLTFIGCIGYIFYDWRREKGDRWAREIERRLSKTISRFRTKMRRK